MISNQNRAGYFGASDVKFIMDTDFNTKTFENWWDIKTGKSDKHITNDAMIRGTLYEHPIMQTFGDLYGINLELDKQIILEDLKLRVNLDANTSDTIYECKTHKLQNIGSWQMPKQYIDQVRVQMFAFNMNKAFIVDYLVKDADIDAAKNGFVLPISSDRLNVTPIYQDMNWINNQFLPRLKYLAYCLTENQYPSEAELEMFKPKSLQTIPNESKFNSLQLKLAELDAQKKAIEMQEKELEQSILEYMESHQIKSYENDVVKITFIAPIVKSTIDSKMLKEKYPDIAKECSKETITKASLRVKVNE